MLSLIRLHLPTLFWRSLVIFLALLLPSTLFGVAQIESVHNQIPDYDSRAGQVILPSGQALGIVSSLGAVATWNQFGTPATLIKYGTHLSSASGDPVVAAKNWIRTNKALFRLSDAGVDSLELLNDSLMTGYNGHAVLFRQKFGAIPSGIDGLIAVGIARNKVYFVSSSVVGDQSAPGEATLSAQLAWVNAATEGGKSVSISQISNIVQQNSWTVFEVSGWDYFQRARLVAFPTPNNGVRPAFESNVVDFKDGILIGFTSFVDAQTGQVLARFNRVNQQTPPDSRTELFTGGYFPPACGPLHGPFAAQSGDIRIDVIATSANPVNDIVINLYWDHDNNPGTAPQIVQAQDLLTSPEHLMYVPPNGVQPGNYFVEICPFDPQNQTADSHAGTITFSKISTAQFPYPPRWKHFPANPTLTLANTDTRKLWCWDMKDLNGQPVPGCNPVHASKPDLFNLAARAPWDHMFRLNAPSFTTAGNAAATSEAWLAAVGPPQVFGSPTALGPGPTGYMPHAADRNYSEGSAAGILTWTNQWQSSKCSPASFATNFNDRDAAAISLFTAHNRMHDWSYFLGFTEKNYNLQEFNFGNTAPGLYPFGRETDPEFGFVQAGAITGGYKPNDPQTSMGGRNNANQLTLQDGIPGLTNMYLFQPNPGISYAPCVDGDYDMSVIGHEYTHAISNRMAGGPDGNLSGAQSTAMGESWSDLTATEYLHEYGFVPTDDENPFAVGPYATGNKVRGIRNYPLNNSPLNYSNIGYDNNGVGPHQDGEIWSATNFDIRQSLIAKYNSTYPASNMTLQRKCADGFDTADHCAGNRRWIQIVFDAWLLMATGSVSMVDARNAYLAADTMRFTGANQTELWKAFAKRGLGKTASSNGAADGDPIPSFESQNEPSATISFKVVSMDETVACGGCNDERSRKPLAAKVYVGRYEARSTALLTTIADHTTTPLPSAKFVPGTYDFLVVAPGYGHFRFQRTFTANQVATIIPWVRRNWASSTNTGAGAATAGGSGTNHVNLIDDTEGTQWTHTGALPSVAGSQVTVDLAGAVRTVNRVQVSALLFGQPRLSALRQFEILTCTASATNQNCTLPPLGFTSIFTSPADAFPGPQFRPTAPDMILRTFTVPSTQATHVQIRVLTNQCTGNTMYQGEQDNDPLTVTDCIAGSTRENEVTISELQVFSGQGGVGVPGDPVVTLEMSAPVTAPAGAYVTYDITYTNFGPLPSANAKITDVLSTDLIFVSATNGGSYNSSTRKVTWNLGTVPVLYTGTVRLTARVNPSAVLGTVITNQAEFTGELTVSPPTAAAVTLVMPEL